MNCNPKWQSELRHKLEQDAFNEKYECLICRIKKDLHIHHLIYSKNKKDYFDPRFWRILCNKCHNKTPKKSGGNNPLDNPKIIKKDSPYQIICDCCKGIFVSLNPNNKFCNSCFKFWIGNWRIYRVLNFNEKMFFLDRGSITFDTSDDRNRFNYMIAEREKLSVAAVIKSEKDKESG